MGKQRALITGASSGLGRVFAEELAKEGYDLVLVARREERLQEIQKELEEKYNASISYIAKDLGTIEGVKEVCDSVEDLDLLINNAGIGLIGDFVDTDLDKELRMIDLNIKSLYYFTKEYGSRMAKRKGGGIINIASTAAFQPVPKFAVYAATKAFVKSFTEAASKELEPFGVHLMTLCPGPTATEFFRVAEFGGKFHTRDKMMMSAEEVVRHGLQAFRKGKRTYVAGGKNRFLIQLSQLAPKELVLRIAEKAFQK